MTGGQFSAVSKVATVLLVALFVIYCQADVAPACKEASVEAISAGTAAAVCAGELVGMDGGPPVAAFDTCLAAIRHALPLLDAAESACQGRSDVLKEIAAYRRQIQKGKETLEIAQGMRTGKISPVDALEKLLKQSSDDK